MPLRIDLFGNDRAMARIRDKASCRAGYAAFHSPLPRRAHPVGRSSLFRQVLPIEEAPDTHHALGHPHRTVQHDAPSQSVR